MPRASTANTGLLRRADQAGAAQTLARQGRGQDKDLGHLTKGEMVLPLNLMKAHPDKVVALVEAMKEMGIDPRTRIVGTPEGPRNPSTGLEEFDEGGGGANDGSASHGGSDTSTGGGGGGPSSGPGSSDPQDGTSAKSGFDGMTADRNSDPANDKGRDAPGYTDTSGSNSYTGISFIDRAIQNVIDNPARTAINAAIGFVPGVGIVNTISGLLGGPTVGDMATAAGRAVASGESLGKDTTDKPDGPRDDTADGSGGVVDNPTDIGGSDLNLSGLPTPDAYVPTGLLTPQTNRLNNRLRPRPARLRA